MPIVVQHSRLDTSAGYTLFTSIAYGEYSRRARPRGVADEFERNFAERGELGAAFAVYRDGEPVLDLWGGVADGTTGRPWDRDTLGLVFSGSKGLVAVCLLILLDRGLLDLDAPVARDRPEFAANGKSAIRVRDVAAHTARLPGLDTPVALDEVTDDRAMAALLAAQAPSADPRARSATTR